MTPEQFQAYCQDRYLNQLDYFNRRSAKSKRLYLFFQTGAIIFAVAAPLLVVSMPEFLKPVTAAVSALAAFFTTALKSFRFHENWTTSRSMHDLLERENYLYIAGLDGYKDSQDVQTLFVERVEALLARESAGWLTSELSATDSMPPAPKSVNTPTSNQKGNQASNQRPASSQNQKAGQQANQHSNKQAKQPDPPQTKASDESPQTEEAPKTEEDPS